MTSDAPYHRLAVRTFVDFGASIAIPAVIAVFFGKWLDGRSGTAPRYLILCVAIALFLTAISVVKKARRYGREYEKLNKSQEQHTPKL